MADWRKHKYTYRENQLARAVKEAANWQCVRCGSGYKVQAHHKTPLHAGGEHVAENLEALCFDCHDREHRHERVRTTNPNVAAWLKEIARRESVLR